MATLVILAAQSFDVSRWNLEKNVSFMAVSLAAMETARQKKIVFYVPEDVLSWTELAKEAPDFIANAIEWMEDLDDILKPLVHFDRSFSANGYWFLSRLCNIHYLHALLMRARCTRALHDRRLSGFVGNRHGALSAEAA